MDGPAYMGVIAGHEPAGVIVAVGEGVTRANVGDRELSNHIAGGGQCSNCRAGYDISCHGPHAAYGWQRDGGHGEFILAEGRSVIPLPKEQSFEDGAPISFGFGKACEGLLRAGVNRTDTLLVTSMRRVGMAVAMLGRALCARRVVGVDLTPSRLEFAKKLGLLDEGVTASETAVEQSIEANFGEHFSVSIDCSGTQAGRSVAFRSTGERGRVGLLGEGGDLLTDVSDTPLHRPMTITASWVTSLARMEKSAEDLVGWNLHPHDIVTHRFGLDDFDEAYKAAAGETGKVCIVNEGD